MLCFIERDCSFWKDCQPRIGDDGDYATAPTRKPLIQHELSLYFREIEKKWRGNSSGADQKEEKNHNKMQNTQSKHSCEQPLTLSQCQHLFKTIEINIWGAGLVIINSVFHSKHVFFSQWLGEKKKPRTKVVWNIFIIPEHTKYNIKRTVTAHIHNTSFAECHLPFEKKTWFFSFCLHLGSVHAVFPKFNLFNDSKKNFSVKPFYFVDFVIVIASATCFYFLHKYFFIWLLFSISREHRQYCSNNPEFQCVFTVETLT